jgi:glucose/arabinose dehydrogenase
LRLRCASFLAVLALLLSFTGTSQAGDLSTQLALTTVASGLSSPLAMAVRTGDSKIYIAERDGQVVPVSGSTVGSPVLDLTTDSSANIVSGGEQGLLGLTFNAAGDKMFVFFTSNTNLDGQPFTDVLREYDFNGTAATSPVDLLNIPDPEDNHNGGNIAFGPDGYLYIGTGDGGGAGDQHGAIGNGQNKQVLLGKMLRIDPNATGYTAPPSNPFVGKPGLNEIWDYGLRNPWRWSFDRHTGALWIGDVGQNRFEEIDVQHAGSGGGWNFGWRRMEGNATYPPGSTLPPPRHYHHPIFVYPHDNGRCAVVGGYVYRGTNIPSLDGAYLFTDNCNGAIRAFNRVKGKAKGQRILDCPAIGDPSANCSVDSPSSFGEDADGELYVLTLNGELIRIDPAT